MFNRKMIGHSLSWAMALCIAGSALFQPVSLRAQEDASEPETTEESQTEETQAEPSPEDVSQSPQMTQQEEIMKFNTEPITGGAFYRGVTIWVSAGPGTFEEGTALQVTAVPGTSDRVGFDVSFYDPTGAKVQPQNDSGVFVSFDIGGNGDLLADGQERKITVYHVNDQGGWETMRSDVTDRPSHHTEITAFQFSEYGVYSEPVQSVPEPKGVPVGSDLAAFLTNVEIMAPTDENGQYVIHPNTGYEMRLSFHENDRLQFDEQAELTYHFPDGIIVNTLQSQTFSLTVTDENGSALIHDNTYEIQDGVLRVRFNSQDANFERLKRMPNVNFTIDLFSYFDETVGEIVFHERLVKQFLYEENADVTIQKSVVYDAQSDTAFYEVQIRSQGNNDQVVIEDRLVGTALILREGVVVESNKHGVLPVHVDTLSVDNGFRIRIDHMDDGEELRLRYSAGVDLTGITRQGTVEQTQNIARVNSQQSPQTKEARADFAGQVKLFQIQKKADGQPEAIGEGFYTQKWIISVNKDHKLMMGGTSITDRIPSDSRPFMHFSEEGIRVHVTWEDGRQEVRHVSWSELVTSSSNGGIVRWEYLAPESDQNAAYEISCVTRIDTNQALGALTLRNGAQIDNAYVEAKTTIGPIGTGEFGLVKKALGTTAEASEWELRLTVPAAGLPECHIVDDFPILVHDGNTYVDYPFGDSIEVQGLLEGESWSIRLSSSGQSATIDFYQSETQNDANKGLMATPDGSPREIVVRFKTAVHSEWLRLAAQDGYASSELRRHRNYARAWSNAYPTETVHASVIPIQAVLQKEVIGQSEKEAEGWMVPTFQYRLTLSGVTEEGIVLRDLFDTDVLKWDAQAGIQIRGGDPDLSDTQGQVTATETPEGMELSVDSFPKQKDGSFYRQYQITYSLMVKDPQALETLQQQAVQSAQGVELNNTAVWNHLQAAQTVRLTYFPYVDKEMITKPDADNGYVAEFQVVINRYAKDLVPDADVLVIQDQLSDNLRLIQDSVRLSPDAGSVQMSHEEATNTLTLSEVPDETTFVLTYRAKVLGSGQTSYSNTIRFGSFEKRIEGTAVIESTGSGTASNPSITLVKRDAQDLSKTLVDATYQLMTVEPEGLEPVVDAQGEPVTFTTGKDGKVLVVGHLQKLGWTLWAGKNYCLVEISAPTGYELDPEPVYFTLTEQPARQTEFDITGEQINVTNEVQRQSIPVSKTWIGPVTQESVRVHLRMNDRESDQTLELNEENGWSGVFENVRVYDEQGQPIQYSVKEEPVPGYRTEYMGDAQNGFLIKNTNAETLDIPITKQWIGPPSKEVQVELLAEETVVDTLSLNEQNQWQGIFENVWKYDPQDGHEIRYSVREKETKGYRAEITGDPSGFILTNTNVKTIDIPVMKKWDGPAQEAVTVHLLADGQIVADIRLSADNQWQHTFTGWMKYDQTDGHAIRYTITEDALEEYTSAITGSADSGFVIINTHHALRAETPEDPSETDPPNTDPPKETKGKEKNEPAKTKRSSSSNTGTNRQIKRWVVIMVCSILGYIGLRWIKRRQSGPRKR